MTCRMQAWPWPVPADAAETTREAPVWIHFPTGRLFRDKKKAPLTEPFKGPARGGRMSR